MFFPEPKNHWGDVAGKWGRGLGTGIQALASMKVQQMQQEHAARKLMPIAEKLGLPKEVAYNPQLFAKMAPEAMKAAADKEWYDQNFGGGVPGQMGGMPYQQPQAEGMVPQQATGALPPQQMPQTEGMIPQQQTQEEGAIPAMPPRRRGLEDMSARELATLEATAPERRRGAIKPIREYKQAEEKMGSQRAFEYEKNAKKDIDISGKILTAANQLRRFVKEHSDYFGPVEGRKPSYLTTSSEVASLRDERDRLLKNLVKLMMGAEGSIGRGSNLMINLTEKSKPIATMLPKGVISALDDIEEVYSAPMKEFEDYSKMTRGKKPPENFMQQLINRSIARYKKAGASVEKIEDQGLENRLEEKAQSMKAGERTIIDGVEYEAVYE